MQIVVLALGFAAAIAAKIYVDKILAGAERQTVSEFQEPGTVTLPDADRKM